MIFALLSASTSVFALPIPRKCEQKKVILEDNLIEIHQEEHEINQENAPKINAFNVCKKTDGSYTFKFRRPKDRRILDWMKVAHTIGLEPETSTYFDCNTDLLAKGVGAWCQGTVDFLPQYLQIVFKDTKDVPLVYHIVGDGITGLNSAGTDGMTTKGGSQTVYGKYGGTNEVKAVFSIYTAYTYGAPVLAIKVQKYADFLEKAFGITRAGQVTASINAPENKASIYAPENEQELNEEGKVEFDLRDLKLAARKKNIFIMTATDGVKTIKVRFEFSPSFLPEMDFQI
jgi:hypothetical protein